MCMYWDTSEKWGLSYTYPEKQGQSYTFCWKKGADHILGSAEKGAIRHAHPYYAYIESISPPPEFSGDTSNDIYSPGPVVWED